jgi:hypothetical protein
MLQSKSSGILFALIASGVLVLTAASGRAQTKNSCVDCHSVLPDNLGVTQETFSHDIHAQKGLTCVSCHGGDASSDDPTQSMSKKAGWKGHIDRRQIPQLCGSCHSDPPYMRKFEPGLRTDQLVQYRTSVHGKRLFAGDDKVAVCTDCHSVHNLRAPNDPQSTVYPVNVATTCSHCHADANHMKGYSIPTDQFAKYNTSVHHNALTVRGDLSAPTCTTCHGNHGAAPPGVDSVPNVCSTCHVFQAQMFEKSSPKAAFDSSHLPGCVVCHQNHAIVHPTDAKLSTQSSGVCMQCHKPGDKCDQARGQILANLTQLDNAIQQADQALSIAEAAGMDVSEARLGQNEARDSLTKARVAIHSFRPDVIRPFIQAGLNTAGKDLKAGQDAMIERDHRRKGLGFSLIAIGMVVLGLRLYINKIER